MEVKKTLVKSTCKDVPYSFGELTLFCRYCWLSHKVINKMFCHPLYLEMEILRGEKKLKMK